MTVHRSTLLYLLLLQRAFQQCVQILFLHLLGNTQNTGVIDLKKRNDLDFSLERFKIGRRCCYQFRKHIPVIVNACSADQNDLRVINTSHVVDGDSSVGTCQMQKLSCPGNTHIPCTIKIIHSTDGRIRLLGSEDQRILCQICLQTTAITAITDHAVGIHGGVTDFRERNTGRLGEESASVSDGRTDTGTGTRNI